MNRRLRLGLHIDIVEPFWLLVSDALHAGARRAAIDFVPLGQVPLAVDAAAAQALCAEWQTLDLDGIITIYMPELLVQQVLAAGMPVIQMTESDLCHAKFVAPLGLYSIALDLGNWLAHRLNGRGRVLIVGGQLFNHGEDGKSRISGLQTALQAHPELEVCHVPSLWTYDDAYAQIESSDLGGEVFAAVVGLSDSLALAARDAVAAAGLIDERSVISGINGDPLALAAIMEGNMTATVQTAPRDLARQVLDLAARVAAGEEVPPRFGYRPTLITAQNVRDAAAQTLHMIAELPSQLVARRNPRSDPPAAPAKPVAADAPAEESSQPSATAITPPHHPSVQRAINYFEEHYPNPISRQALANAVGLSKDHLSHVFRQTTGLSPWEYLTRYRIQQAKQRLRETYESITEIAIQTGFDDLSYFNRVFRKHLGCSPSRYRNQFVRRESGAELSNFMIAAESYSSALSSKPSRIAQDTVKPI